MPRKQLGAIDADLLLRVDERARVLGQTRRVFVERAVERALGGESGSPDAYARTSPAPAEQPEGEEPYNPSIVPAQPNPPLSRAEAFRRATQKR